MSVWIEDVIETIFRIAGKDGTFTAHDIAEAMGKDPRTISGVLIRMEGSGYVRSYKGPRIRVYRLGTGNLVSKVRGRFI